MKNRVWKYLLAACAALSVTATTSFAQGPAHSHDGHNHGDHAGHAHSGESLAFQLSNWKSMHFDDAQKAAKHLDTVKKLGCEVKQTAHDGHTDLSYRCPAWKTLAVSDHKLAEQWTGWLTASGFDVSHAHADPNFMNGSEVVEFRLIRWRSMHGTNSPQEQQLIKQLQRVGCEVVVEQHGGHSDIRFRAPTWRDIHLADHASAEKWSSWFKQNGFEVQHAH